MRTSEVEEKSKVALQSFLARSRGHLPVSLPETSRVKEVRKK